MPGSTGTNDAVLSRSGNNNDVSSPDGLTEGDADAGGDVDGSGALAPSSPPHELRNRAAARAATRKRGKDIGHHGNT